MDQTASNTHNEVTQQVMSLLYIPMVHDVVDGAFHVTPTLRVNQTGSHC